MASFSFDKISAGWKRLAGVIAAVTTLTTVTVEFTGWEILKVGACYVLAGAVVLFSGWMLDDHIKKFDETNEENEKRFDRIDECLKVIKEHSLETHKDTVRLQLLHLFQSQPENIDTILVLSEKYFCQLEGDWYLTNMFMSWAEKHGVNSDIALSCKVERKK